VNTFLWIIPILPEAKRAATTGWLTTSVTHKPAKVEPTAEYDLRNHHFPAALTQNPIFAAHSPPRSSIPCLAIIFARSSQIPNLQGHSMRKSVISLPWQGQKSPDDRAFAQACCCPHQAHWLDAFRSRIVMVLQLMHESRVRGLGSNGTESALKPSACPQTLVASG